MLQNKELELASDFIEKTDRNLFLTGKAGTGKTSFLHQLRTQSLKRMVVVAPTGVAAINAKGVTIHSFFQLPFGPILPNSSSAYANSIQRKFSKTKIDIIKSLDLVVIDEVSMVRADVLDAIDEVLRRYRDRTKPFGGAQVLMIGDLQQLAPVIKPAEWNLLKSHYRTAYFFSSNVFQQAKAVAIELKHIYRQQNETFITILNEIRNNQLSEASAALLNKQYQPNFEPQQEDGYITLTTHNKNANTINQNELDKLTSTSRTYTAEVYKDFNEKNFPNDEHLTLKVGAQVMFIKNDSTPEKRYYNGKIGTITALEEDMVTVKCAENDTIEATVETWENVKYTIDQETQEITEKLEGSYTQIPLRLAWAITIHKSQGLTFNKAIIDAEASFAHGQTYVALSRCTSLEGLVLKTPIRHDSIINDQTVSSFTKQVEENLPSAKELQASKKEFQLNLIDELFNFHLFLQPINRLIDLYYTHKNVLEGNLIQPLQTLKDEGIVPLLKVSNSFKIQLKNLSEESNEPEKDTAIQERFQKALAYFTKEVTEKIKVPLDAISYTTDNKQVEKDLSKPLQFLEEQLQIKLFCFEKLNQQFSVSHYLKIRAEAQLLQPKKKRKSKAAIPTLKHTQLFDELRWLRDTIAVSENLNHFQVFTQKSLYEMCDQLPTTAKQLRKINGMGKVRVQKYGAEILELIQQYCEEHNIETKTDEPEIIAVKVNTKQVTLELFQSGMSVAEIAEKRELTTGTIESHLAHYIEAGELDITEFFTKKKLEKAKKIINAASFESLTQIKEIVEDEYSYGELRMILSWMKSQ